MRLRPRCAAWLLRRHLVLPSQYCRADLPADKRRITLAVEAATVPVVNDVVRAFFAPVRDVLRRQSKSGCSVPGGASPRNQPVEADEAGDDWYEDAT